MPNTDTTPAERARELAEKAVLAYWRESEPGQCDPLVKIILRETGLVELLAEVERLKRDHESSITEVGRLQALLWAVLNEYAPCHNPEWPAGSCDCDACKLRKVVGDD